MSAKTTKRVNSENFICVLMGSIIFALGFGCDVQCLYLSMSSPMPRKHPRGPEVIRRLLSLVQPSVLVWALHSPLYINYCSIIQICGVSTLLLDNSSSA